MQSIQLHKFNIADKNLFDKAYNSLKFPLGEHNFKWLYLWNGFYTDMEWAMIHGNLCLFATFEGNRYVWGPSLPGNRLQDTLDACFNLCSIYNKERKIKSQPAALYIPEELTDSYSGLRNFSLKHQNQDYIYESKALISLEGGKYKKKRNLISSFLKHSNVRTEQYSMKHQADCLSLLKKWKDQKSQTMPEDTDEKGRMDAAVTEKTLLLAAELGLQGMVVYVNGKIEGFTFGIPYKKDMAVIFFEKTNLNIKGLAPFIFTEFVKKYWSKYQFINAMEDWDVEYLKVTKMSYRPVRLRKSYMLVKKQ